RTFAVLEGNKLTFDLVKFRGIDDILAAFGEYSCDVRLSLLNSITGRWMGRKRLSEPTRLFLLLSLNFFEEGNKGSRIITGLVHVFQAEEVCFGFCLSTEMQELQRDQETCCIIELITKATT